MKNKPIKPNALKSGDTVAVVASAAAIERAHLERGVNVLASMGFRVKVSERALARSGILAGDDRERASELQEYFADPEVKAIFSARGGYGCGRLLPLLDFKAMADTPKIFVGFSDATFLLNALVDFAGMVSFHGPMVAMDFARGLSPRSLEHLQGLLSGRIDSFELEARETMHPGNAQGEVIGGCLSVVVAMIGTPFEPRFDGRILFLEDTGEKAYRIDRMLVQLRQSGALGRVAGIVFRRDSRDRRKRAGDPIDSALCRRADRGSWMPGAVRYRGGAWHREFYDSVRRGCANRFRRAPDYFYRAAGYAVAAVFWRMGVGME